MNYDALLGILEEADSESWHVIERAGHTHRDGHYGTAVYIPDTGLTVAWGRDADGVGDGAEEWWWDVLDKTVHNQQIDFFWNGSLVHRVEYAGPDGGRSVVPWPDGNRTVDRHELQVVRLLDGLRGGSMNSVDSTMQTAKLTVRE
ncbi:hypothetical protein AYK61_01405 [Rhodococcus sp. SBT000017]|uniref:hypothetical protein n=1 Tax=unclassified Rhodococcus (in: high G+C Gram-positive bacteria) TaxID=192944 RepID=UPI000EF85CDD|nr:MULTISPECIES: hypothetical protein [unclassified Rhodococcus (in: high G+C Gram-positive bacteria)]RMB75454.1 hypothetical protein AYK61_01405 [Rhodococcus sp. SBT000017]